MYNVFRLSHKLATSFQIFQVSFFLVKMINDYEVYAVFQDIAHQLQENILHCFLYYGFFIKSSLNWEVSSIHSNLFSGSVHDIFQPYKLITFQY